MGTQDDILYRLVGEKLKTRRTFLKRTQDQVAADASMVRASLANIESGRQRAPLHVIYRLCEVLELKPLEILPTPEDLAAFEPNRVPVEFNGIRRPLPALAAQAFAELRKGLDQES